MKIMVLTSASLVNDAYGAFPIISVPNIKSTGEFHAGYGPRGKAASHDAPTDAAKPVSEADEIKQLRHEVDYLKQEMEFLKNFLDQNYKEVGALLMNDSSCIFEIIYNTMQQSHNIMSVKTLCEMAGVSRSGYYAWSKPLLQENLKNSRTVMTLI